MPATTKTKQQLTAEISALRSRVKELEQAGGAHRESEALFHSIYEQSPVGIEIYDADGHLLEVNRECLKMFGVESVETVQGFNLFEDPNVPANAKARLLKHETVKYEAQFDFDLVREHNLYETTKSGLCYLDTLITPLGDSGGQITGYLVHVRDITDRKQAEQALQESERKYRDLVETSQDLIWQLDDEGRFTFLNGAWENVLGYSLDEMLGRLFVEFKPPEFADRDLKTYKSIFGGGQVLNYETVYLTKSGEKRQLVFKAGPRRDRAGKIVGTQGTANDISDRTKAEIALRKHEERLLLAQQVSGMGFLDWDLRTNEIELSDEVINLYGLDPDSKWITPELVTKIVHPGDLDQVQKELEQAIRGERDYDIDHRVVRPDGTILWVHAQAKLIYDTEGNPLRLLGTMVDITERKQAEMALLKSEERFRTVADFTYDWETWVGPQGNNLYISPSCERISGYSVQEFLDDPELLRKITHPDDQNLVAAHYDQPLATLEGTTLDFRIIHRSGEIRWISHACQPVITDDGEFLGRRGGNRDITMRKQIEAKHELLFKQLEGKNKDLEQIIHVTSHDLRSPLISIKGFSEVVVEAVDKLPAIVKRGALPAELLDELQQLLADDIVKPLEFITAGAEKMDTLLSGLMRLSRLGQLALSIKPLDMNTLLEEVVRSIQFQVDSTGADIVIKELPSCLGDDAQINQLFTNLLDNALKYLDSQRPGRIEVSGQQQGSRVEYCVADNGIGIAPRDQALVFMLFHRVDDATSIEGEGLGLNIMSKILDRHGGDIRLESEPGVGSRFFVNLPAGQ